MKKSSWTYGRDPHPKNWHEAADMLKGLAVKPPRKSSGVLDRLTAIEKGMKKDG